MLERPLVRPAECPACTCEVVNRVYQAWNVAGDGSKIRRARSGETVRCCACGCVFTVTLDNRVLTAKASRAAEVIRRQQAKADSPPRGFDDDLADLDADLPAV